MKKFYWVFFCVTLLLCMMFTFTGCRIFDLFSNDSTSQQSSLSYTPPPVPETLEQEKPAVKAMVDSFAQALEAKNIEKALVTCIRPDRYKAGFQTNLERTAVFGKLVKNSELAFVGGGYTQNGVRIGELKVDYASRTFSITIVKIDGKWFIQDL